MLLTELLAEQHICTALRAEHRDDAVQELLRQLQAAGKLNAKQVADALKAIVQREALGTTAIGRGVAVPHARIDGLAETVVALGLSRPGVEFNALDKAAVSIVFLVVGSTAGSDQYIDTMRSVSLLIQNDDFRRFLARARTAGEVVELVAEMEG